MRDALQRFFSGRNGVDDLSRFLSWVSVFFLLLGMFTLPVFSSMGLAFFVYGTFRSLSRNLYRRSLENDSFLAFRARITGWFCQRKNRFAQRKTHRFYKCPSCKQTVRVPKGRGKIAITCPSCRAQFVKKS